MQLLSNRAFGTWCKQRGLARGNYDLEAAKSAAALHWAFLPSTGKGIYCLRRCSARGRRTCYLLPGTSFGVDELASMAPGRSKLRSWWLMLCRQPGQVRGCTIRWQERGHSILRLSVRQQRSSILHSSRIEPALYALAKRSSLRVGGFGPGRQVLSTHNPYVMWAGAWGTGALSVVSTGANG